jgi:hypothetical protein
MILFPLSPCGRGWLDAVGWLDEVEPGEGSGIARGEWHYVVRPKLFVPT